MLARHLYSQTIHSSPYICNTMVNQRNRRGLLLLIPLYVNESIQAK